MDTWLYRIISLPKKLGGIFNAMKSLVGGGSDKNKGTDPQSMLKELRNKVQIAQKNTNGFNSNRIYSRDYPYTIIHMGN